MRLVAAALAALFAAVGASGAHAASFNCAKAKSAMEKAICADRNLSAKDEAMARVYAADLAQLSPEGREALRESQRRYLAYAAVVCDRSVADGQCLAAQFEERKGQLKSAVTVAGGHRFLYTTRYRARTVTDSESSPGETYAVEEVVTGVRIDAPRSEAERVWNREAKRREVAGLKMARDCCDGASTFETDDSDTISVGTVVISASPDLVVSVVTGSHYAHGTAHALETQTEAQIWSLRFGRALMPSDILDERTRWRENLLPVAQAQLKAASAGEPLDDLSMDFAEPRRWQLKADGIHVVYSEYELGSYLSAAESLLDWTALKPYLRRDLPFRPQDLQSADDGVIY